MQPVQPRPVVYASAPGYGPQGVYVAAAQPGYTSAPPADAARARFNAFVAAREIKYAAADDLYGVLTTSRVVLLLDDSGSMNTAVTDPMTGASGGFRQSTTRWTELEKMAACVVDIVTSTTPAGCDVVFLNRPGVGGVTQPAQLAASFAAPPTGGTPLCGALARLFQKFNPTAVSGTRVIVIVVTDGEPSDGNASDLYHVLRNQRHAKVHVGLVAFNDNKDEMAFLDMLDDSLPNIDVCSDFATERRQVLNRMGSQHKFTYMDYAIKAILGSVMSKYDNLDTPSQPQGQRQYPQQVQRGPPPPDSGCCSVS